MKVATHTDLPKPVMPIKTYDLIGLTELQYEAIVEVLGSVDQGNDYGKAVNDFFVDLASTDPGYTRVFSKLSTGCSMITIRRRT